MTIQEMCQRKQQLGYSYEKIAELSNLPLSTVQKVLGGITKSPRYDTLKALEEVFKKPTAQLIAEAPLSDSYGKKQGDFTLEDYYQIPDDIRVELIDGVIYDMAAPTSLHQLICLEIGRLLREYIKKNKGSCIPLVSPLDVQLDCDNKTMVQPDVIIVCDRKKFLRGVVYGAPDFVVEILSPSTQRKDLSVKLAKYMNAGVREYWIVDPIKKRIIVYDIEHDAFPEMYTFEHQVPVRIFDGKCTIDFKEIFEYAEFLYNSQ